MSRTRTRLILLLAAAVPWAAVSAGITVSSAAATPAATEGTPVAGASAIDGIYQTTFSKEDLAASPMLVDQGEIDDLNWGDWTLSFWGGRMTYTQSNSAESSSASGTFSVDGDAITLAFDSGLNAGENFAYRWTRSPDTLTFTRDESLGLPGPTPFLVKPWTRTADALAVPSPAGAFPVEAALQSVWVGETRPVPGLGDGQVQSAVLLKPDNMAYYAFGNGAKALDSSASQESNERLKFVSTQDGSGCHAGDAGYYQFSLSPSGLALTLSPIAEACAARSAALSRDWIKQDCPDPNNACLGDLDPGPHVSILFTPFVPPATWHFDYGRFSYIAPIGWQNLEDNPDGYVLSKRGAPDGAAIFVFSNVLPHAQGDCNGKAATGVGRSQPELVTWMTQLPALSVTNPVSATIGSLDGAMLDVSVSPSWSGTCRGDDGKPSVQLFVDEQQAGGLDWGIGGDGRMRLWLLDLGDGRTLVVDIEGLDKPAWDALVPLAMPVVQTFRFSH